MFKTFLKGVRKPANFFVRQTKSKSNLLRKITSTRTNEAKSITDIMLAKNACNTIRNYVK